MLTAFSRFAIRTATVLLVSGGLAASLQAAPPSHCATQSAASAAAMCSPSRASLMAPSLAYYYNTYQLGLPYGRTSNFGCDSRTVVIYSARSTVNVFPSVDPSLVSNMYLPSYGYPYYSPSQMQVQPQWPVINPSAGNLFANPYTPAPYPTNFGTYPSYAMGNYPNGTFMLGSNGGYPYSTNSFNPLAMPQQFAPPMNPTFNAYTPTPQYLAPMSPSYNPGPYATSPGSYPVSMQNYYGNIPGTPVSSAYETFPR